MRNNGFGTGSLGPLATERVALWVRHTHTHLRNDVRIEGLCYEMRCIIRVCEIEYRGVEIRDEECYSFCLFSVFIDKAFWSVQIQN